MTDFSIIAVFFAVLLVGGGYSLVACRGMIHNTHIVGDIPVVDLDAVSALSQIRKWFRVTAEQNMGHAAI